MRAIVLLSGISLLINFEKTPAIVTDRKPNFCQAREASCIVEAFGYAPQCVFNALASCERNPLYSSIQQQLKVVKEAAEKLLEQRHSRLRPRHCADVALFSAVVRTSGIHVVYPFKSRPNWPVLVYCDLETDGGKWTVLMRREGLTNPQNFHKTWEEYVLGFGNCSDEFWLGLEAIHALTNAELMEMRLEVEDFQGNKRFLELEKFIVGNRASKYSVSTAGKHLGNSGHSLRLIKDGTLFSTWDEDNDGSSSNCAESHEIGWWYDSCNSCTLHQVFFRSSGFRPETTESLTWPDCSNSFKRTVMMIRPALKY